MNKLLLISLGLALSSCMGQGNPKITYRDYSAEFDADGYPKSIIDSYRNDEKMTQLSDREIAIKINADMMKEELLDHVLQTCFREKAKSIREDHFNSIKAKLKQFYLTEEGEVYSEGMLTDRARQWIADSITQEKYGGKIYFDEWKKTPKPKEAYKKMLHTFIQNGEISISDAFLKEEILRLVQQSTQNQKEIRLDFNRIETWSISK
jgi:hypothetical protein